MRRLRVAVAVALAVIDAGAVRAADAARGQALFQKTCASCHNSAPDALGPSLVGVVGRGAAAVADFRYSGPLRRSGLIWTRGALTAFIRSPQSVVKGNRMPFSGVAAPEDADDIVAYLAVTTAPDPTSR